MDEHECVIGIINDYECTREVTISALKEHIEWHNGYYKLADYADRRKSTDLTRFTYCPYCGKKIDWKKIRENAV